MLLITLFGCGPGSHHDSAPPRINEAVMDNACRLATAQTEQTLQQIALPSPDWSASWIGPVENRANLWVCYRASFTLGPESQVVPARIAVDTKYWLWINGALVVREGGLKRGPSPEGTYYDSIDLSTYLRPGSNSIAILQWYLGKDGFSHRDSSRAAALFEMRAGNTPIGSGLTWRARVHPAFSTCPVPAPNFRLAESNILYDARNELPRWTQPNYDDSGWPLAMDLGRPGSSPWGSLVPRPIPNWKSVDLEAFAQVEVKDGCLVATLPFNQRFTLWMDLEAPAGCALDLETDTAFIGTESTVRAGYITREGRQQFETFGWMSGHELRITLPPGVHIFSLKFRSHAYQTGVLGTFRCSDPFLTQLWEKAVRTLQIDMADSWMDCPDRERAPWPGDSTIAAGQAPYVMDARSGLLARKGLVELSRWAREDEVLYGPVPSGNWRSELPLQTLAAIGRYGPMTYFTHTNDKALLQEIYPAVKAYLLDVWNLDDGGLVIHRTGDWDWGDWGDNVDLPLLDNTWYLIAVDAAAEMASLLGRSEDIPAFQARGAAIRAAFNQAFWDGHAYRSLGHAGDPDERGNAMAVLAGLNRPEQTADLVAILTRVQHSSPYMEKYVLEALCQLGSHGKALDRISQRYRPMVDSANSTLFEVFPADGSPDHVWSGGVLTVLAQDILGLRPTSPGWNSFEVIPQIGPLNSIGLDMPTPHGMIMVDTQGHIWGRSMHLRVPPGASAVAGLPIYGPGDVVTINGARMTGLLPSSGVMHRIPLAAGSWDLAVVRSADSRPATRIVRLPAPVRGVSSPGVSR